MVSSVQIVTEIQTTFCFCVVNKIILTKTVLNFFLKIYKTVKANTSSVLQWSGKPDHYKSVNKKSGFWIPTVLYKKRSIFPGWGKVAKTQKAYKLQVVYMTRKGPQKSGRFSCKGKLDFVEDFICYWFHTAKLLHINLFSRTCFIYK